MAGLVPAMSFQDLWLRESARHTPRAKGRLPNGWQLATDSGGLARFDERRRAEIDVADIGENAHRSHNGRAQKANDDDLQMGAAVRAVHRVVHGNLPFSRV